ncbi:MAG: MbcA/ParS/Xre antitoxin family protein [Xanthobacteraceae bacterium]|nr:MbcA/ParS/Xre antitoxin family protein [Xanthobacteraceae bacterium]
MKQTMRPNPHPAPAPSDSAIVTKAAVRAADKLGLTNRILARVIGVSEASVSRMKKGEFPLEPHQKPFELAVLFVRLYRSLDAVVGGDDAVARAWMANENTALNAAPLELIQNVAGLTNVIQYLDARRAVV